MIHILLIATEIWMTLIHTNDLEIRNVIPLVPIDLGQKSATEQISTPDAANLLTYVAPVTKNDKMIFTGLAVFDA